MTPSPGDLELADRHLDEVLHALAGPDAVPRDDQRQAVRSLVVDHARVLVVQATGWGKSAVYWAATAALRADGAGLTLVVSPLLALMRDQVAAASRAGLRAATINSTNLDEWDDVLAQVDAGTLDVLLVSPERLANPRFAARLPQLLAGTGMVVIDEAHCISDWGFDFRPDYQRLARHLLTLAPGTPVLATTATANERVTIDVAHQLGEHTVTYRGSLARTSLQLAVVGGLGSLQRWAWVADALHEFPGSGIVYVLTVAEAERLAAFLQSAGHHVAAYSGRLETDRARRHRGRAPPQPAQSRRRHIGARHGLRQTRPRLLHPRRLAGLARRVLPAGGPSGSGTRRRDGGAAAQRRRRSHLALLRHGHHPRPRPGPASPRVAAGWPGHAPLDRGRDGHPPRSARGSAEAARRRRCRRQVGRRLAGHRNALRPRRRQVARAAGDARATRPR